MVDPNHKLLRQKSEFTIDNILALFQAGPDDVEERLPLWKRDFCDFLYMKYMQVL